MEKKQTPYGKSKQGKTPSSDGEREPHRGKKKALRREKVHSTGEKKSGRTLNSKNQNLRGGAIN